MSSGKHNVSSQISVRLANCQVAENALGTDEDRRRFWAKVRIVGEDHCWEWLGAKFRRGYGSFMWASRYGRKAPQGAHRCAWEMTFGPIPEGGHVLHSCDNRGCVNPKHLFLGDHKANMEDAAQKGRLHSIRPNSQRLTADQIHQIRAAVAVGPRGTATRLAREHGVTLGYISRICSENCRPFDAPLVASVGDRA